jgi:hypothetical protein
MTNLLGNKNNMIGVFVSMNFLLMTHVCLYANVHILFSIVIYIDLIDQFSSYFQRK